MLFEIKTRSLRVAGWVCVPKYFDFIIDTFLFLIWKLSRDNSQRWSIRSLRRKNFIEIQWTFRLQRLSFLNFFFSLNTNNSFLIFTTQLVFFLLRVGIFRKSEHWIPIMWFLSEWELMCKIIMICGTWILNKCFGARYYLLTFLLILFQHSQTQNRIQLKLIIATWNCKIWGKV